ncbi:YgcG family protein [Klebsiella sp. RHBSTW-00215]|uniref:TPM domain-containing protein n=1 Tax=Klebsiella sp. RHBSTW-00215 TaxID=2742640 RepID=UPI0015F4C3D1|nr:YgcG family protein [Klebsiella sp. RHBSTW-00215]MBA7929867.1 YgcG family protein [Klebsiella sp. RHBSTW-00215]
MRVIIFLLIVFSFQSFAEPVPVPELRYQVTDLTHTLSEAQTNVLTQEVHAIPGQAAILVVPTSGEETIEQYATRVFDAWKLGDQKRDDGILLLVAWQDHTVRIEVGYGLEGTLTDVQAGQIIRQKIIPAFKNGDLMAGLQQGVAAIGAHLASGEQLPVSTSAPMPFSGGWALLIWAVVLLFIAIRGGLKTLGVICTVAIILAFALPISGHAAGWGKLFALLSFATPFIVFLILMITPTAAGRAFRKIVRASNTAKEQKNGRSSGRSGIRAGRSSRDNFRGGGGSSGGGGASGRW